MVSKMGLDVTPSELKEATNSNLSLETIETVIEIQEEMGDKVLSPTEIKVFILDSNSLRTQALKKPFLNVGCCPRVQSH